MRFVQPSFSNWTSLLCCSVIPQHFIVTQWLRKQRRFWLCSMTPLFKSLLSKVILFKHFIFLFKCANYGPVFGSVVGETSAQWWTIQNILSSFEQVQTGLKYAKICLFRCMLASKKKQFDVFLFLAEDGILLNQSFLIQSLDLDFLIEGLTPLFTAIEAQYPLMLGQ